MHGDSLAVQYMKKDQCEIGMIEHNGKAVSRQSANETSQSRAAMHSACCDVEGQPTGPRWPAESFKRLIFANVDRYRTWKQRLTRKGGLKKVAESRIECVGKRCFGPETPKGAPAPTSFFDLSLLFPALQPPLSNLTLVANCSKSIA
jgi:hypothetical protein